MGLEYKKMSLFDAPEGSIIVHACNAQGSWNSGIAKEFKERYPRSFQHYEEYCRLNPRHLKVGRGKLLSSTIEHKHKVGILITSNKYGAEKDPKELIKIQTTLAINQLLETNLAAHGRNPSVKGIIYSNKFNSGLFKVPWKETELILTTVLKHYSWITWIVCDPNHETD